MRKIVLIMTAVLISLSLFSCGLKTYYLELLYPVDDVKEIKIVELTARYVGLEEGYTLLKEIDIEYAADVFKDIQSVEYKLLGPSPGTANGTVIMIVYESGEYEIISRSGPQQYKYSQEDGCIRQHHSYYHCRNNEVFDQMIDKWLNHTENVGDS